MNLRPITEDITGKEAAGIIYENDLESYNTASTISFYSLYGVDIIVDSEGWAVRYETAIEPSTLLRNNVYFGLDIVTDKNGFVKSGVDWKNRELKQLFIEDTIPSIFNVVTDYAGNVRSFFKTAFVSNSSAVEAPNRLINCFSQDMTVVQGEAHYGFPGICSGKGGVLHAFYRKALYHTGVDGSVMYSYSLDYGKTWSEEITALEGGDELDGWFGDWRDAKAIRMSNGNFLLSHTKGYAKENGGTPPYHVDYDQSKYKTYAIIYSQLSSGVLDIENPKLVELPKPAEASFIFGAGGLVERDGIIYYTVYGNTPNTCWLFKSPDFGESWQFVSKIQDGYNENSLAFIDDVLFCIMRNINGNARIVKSSDFGISWQIVKDIDTYYHGMYALSLGDTIMIAGRAYDSRTNIVFMDRFGNFCLSPIPIGRQGDSSYADICTFENYVYVIYYAQLSNTNWGIYVRRVERNKVIGLSH